MSMIETSSAYDEDERREPLGLRLWLLPETIAWLIEIAQGSDERAAMYLSKCIDDIAVDDQATHRKLN